MSLFIDELVEENAKFKKAIKILKEMDFFSVKPFILKPGYFVLFSNEGYYYISEEDYYLLKEVLGNE